MKELQDIKIMYIAATGGLAGVKDVWEKLESKIGSLKGRKFYGAYFNATGEYRACVAMNEDDGPAALGLDVGVIPRGKYAEAKLQDWPSNTHRIPEIFAELASSHDVDSSRPSIEFYRSQRELILLLPIE